MIDYHKIIVGVVILLFTLTAVVTFISKDEEENFIEMIKLALKSLGNILALLFVLSILSAGVITIASGLNIQ